MIRHQRVAVTGTTLHTVIAGDGDPVVLLHGWPVTWYHWRDLIPILARKHTVIAPDLRGLGDSDRPLGAYGKETLAADIAELTDQLGIGRFALVGHDFGGSVACALAAAHRDKVSHLVIEEELLAGCPVPFDLVSPQYPRWHNAFHAVPDVPELLITGKERDHLNLFWSLTTAGTAFSRSVIEEYERTYLTPGALRVGLAYYRSGAEDAELNRRTAHRPLEIPVLAIGGSEAMATAVEASVRQIASEVSGVVVDDCGHYPAEEHPRQVAELIAAFLP
ncbi:MAG TPA: alpha/beta hydrolase [Kribbella sp.]|uniref:alpha/beta fold hydrolase n=1 Tax=Kribbella sp. TaxID=1871183 RepID=UPI002D773F19|nr:alpha/beta hydrolase [Kribbella sp.]HET6293058.1 alpha/beta hydrolase [Kribbella sp.]